VNLLPEVEKRRRFGREVSGRELVGRDEELATLEQLLEAVRNGGSGTLFVQGDPGIGKSALLERLINSSAGFRVVRAVGVQGEVDLPYAGLQQLCRPMLDTIGTLPPPQRQALHVAFGLSSGEAPDRYLVGLAVLTLFSEAAATQPLLCVVDDAHWLDTETAQALAFVARRLGADTVGLVIAGREQATVFDGLPVLHLAGLAIADARAILDSTVVGGFDGHVRERFLAETHGNPLALLQLPKGLTPAELAGGFGLPRARGLSSRIERSLEQQVRALPPETQQALLVAAAEGVGDPGIIAAAVAELGVGADALVPGEDAELVELGARVRFCHPLMRSAAYHAATPHERRRVHEALAAVTDGERDPDRRAWHRGHATAVPDESVAAELEGSSERAQARGGLMAAAAFLEQAAILTPDPARRGARALAAAQLKFDAGAPDAAERLLAIAVTAPLEELDRARVDRLRAQIAFARSGGGDAATLLSAAAQRLEPLDPELARETHLEALLASIRSDRFARDDAVVDAAAAAAARSGEEHARAIDLMLAAVVTRLTEGYESAQPTAARALTAFHAEGFNRENLAWWWLACQLAMDSWDNDGCEEIAKGLGGIARDSGGLVVLPFALNYCAAHRIFRGAFGVADELLEEAESITAATRNPPLSDFSALLNAWRGDRERTEALRGALIEVGTARGEAFAVEVAEWAAAVLHNGLGEYAEAQAASERALEQRILGFDVWVLPELVEAAVRNGDRQVAALAFERLVERSRGSRSEWARGVEAAARALLSDDAGAERHHVQAIEHLGASGIAVLHARARLSYGEWLRREGRRIDARQQLRAALDVFEAMGAEAFADRTRRELAATGETARKRVDETRADLTAQETQIVRLAADGLTNPQIGARLFLSPRTIEWHLRRTYPKLGISSRRQLHTVVLPV
jgi:DNA-binding NarL/FixJ family response regulator